MQEQDPWTASQLLQPKELAKILEDKKSVKPVLMNIGPAGDIKGCLDIGSVEEESSFNKLKNSLDNLPRDTAIVIYCGCCPFDKCPNIRPAFELLNQMKFTNHKLLSLPQNLKVDWIDKGFPIE